MEKPKIKFKTIMKNTKLKDFEKFEMELVDDENIKDK